VGRPCNQAGPSITCFLNPLLGRASALSNDPSQAQAASCWHMDATAVAGVRDDDALSGQAIDPVLSSVSNRRPLPPPMRILQTPRGRPPISLHAMPMTLIVSESNLLPLRKKSVRVPAGLARLAVPIWQPVRRKGYPRSNLRRGPLLRFDRRPDVRNCRVHPAEEAV
jgi:hypothetical protein